MLDGSVMLVTPITLPAAPNTHIHRNSWKQFGKIFVEPAIGHVKRNFGKRAFR